MPGCTHCHHDDTAAPTAAFRKVLWLALFLNAAMFALEWGAGALANSVSLWADALDFLGDSAAFAITLMVLHLSPLARTRAAQLKAVVMGGFGLWVLWAALQQALGQAMPQPPIMLGVALAALGTNLLCAIMLYKYRMGDANSQSIWLCSRNDALGNMAVLLAAFGVAQTAQVWPDIVVAVILAALNISAAAKVLHLSRAELRQQISHQH